MRVATDLSGHTREVRHEVLNMDSALLGASGLFVTSSYYSPVHHIQILILRFLFFSNLSPEGARGRGFLPPSPVNPFDSSHPEKFHSAALHHIKSDTSVLRTEGDCSVHSSPSLIHSSVAWLPADLCHSAFILQVCRKAFITCCGWMKSRRPTFIGV